MTIPNIELSYKRIEHKITFDAKIFKPHDIIERRIMNYRKLKLERWYIQMDCITGKFKKRRFDDLEE